LKLFTNCLCISAVHETCKYLHISWKCCRLSWRTVMSSRRKYNHQNSGCNVKLEVNLASAPKVLI